MGNAIAITPQEMRSMAEVLAASNMFGLKTPAQAHALMLLAQAEGRHPATVAQDYHIIQGRPALKADAILARFGARGGKVEWLQYTDTVCEAKFTAGNGNTLTVEWNIPMAKNAGIYGNDTWKKYPRAMLRSRTISEGVRAVDPAVLGGLYTPEEMQDATLREEVSLAATLPESTEPITDEQAELQKRMKYLRGKLNTRLLELKTGKEVRDACSQFQREHGKAIWEAFTHHNGTETFRSLVDEHLARTQSNEEDAANKVEAIADFKSRLLACDNKATWDELSKEMEITYHLQDNIELSDMLSQKAVDLGIVDEAIFSDVDAKA